MIQKVYIAGKQPFRFFFFIVYILCCSFTRILHFIHIFFLASGTQERSFFPWRIVYFFLFLSVIVYFIVYREKKLSTKHFAYTYYVDE